MRFTLSADLSSRDCQGISFEDDMGTAIGARPRRRRILSLLRCQRTLTEIVIVNRKNGFMAHTIWFPRCRSPFYTVLKVSPYTFSVLSLQQLDWSSGTHNATMNITNRDIILTRVWNMSTFPISILFIRTMIAIFYFAIYSFIANRQFFFLLNPVWSKNNLNSTAYELPLRSQTHSRLNKYFKQNLEVTGDWKYPPNISLSFIAQQTHKKLQALSAQRKYIGEKVP